MRKHLSILLYSLIILFSFVDCGVTKPGALDELTSGRCPDKYSCDPGYTCSDLGKKGMVCVKNEIPPMPKPDMGTVTPPDMSMPEPPIDPQSLACFQKYMTSYQSRWYPLQWYQNGGIPSTGCADCTATFTSTRCKGRAVQEWNCMSSGTVSKFLEGEGYVYTVIHVNGQFQDPYQCIDSQGSIMCSVGSLGNLCPAKIYQYFVTWCDQYI